MQKILVYYLRPYYLRMSIGFIIKFVGSIMDLCLPWILAYMIDTIIPVQDKRQIYLWCYKKPNHPAIIRPQQQTRYQNRKLYRQKHHSGFLPEHVKCLRQQYPDCNQQAAICYFPRGPLQYFACCLHQCSPLHFPNFP